MKIEELKSKIASKTIDDSFKVFVASDYSSYFIIDQYVHKIADIKGLEIKHIDNFSEIGDGGFADCGYLYIYKVDEYDNEFSADNLIVVCNKSKIKEAIVIPKLEKWQFVDYLKFKLPGMSKTDLEWLMTQYEVTDSRVTQTNYFRLDNDMDKVSIFSESVQSMLFDELYNSGEYNTISNLTIFDLTNAIIKRDTGSALQVLKVFDYIDSKPHVWILSILLNSFRNIIAVQADQNIKAEDLGISDKQLYVIKKHNIGYYSTEELVKIYSMLTNVEYMYKFGGLTQEQLADYIICNILGDSK